MGNRFINIDELLESIGDIMDDLYGKKYPQERCPSCGRHNVRIKDTESNCFYFDCAFIESDTGEE